MIDRFDARPHNRAEENCGLRIGLLYFRFRFSQTVPEIRPTTNCLLDIFTTAKRNDAARRNALASRTDLPIKWRQVIAQIRRNLRLPLKSGNLTSSRGQEYYLRRPIKTFQFDL
jgi:hypothetical protein